jgi:hypothetical protein
MWLQIDASGRGEGHAWQVELLTSAADIRVPRLHTSVQTERNAW